jgi:hypothetical protein
MAMYQDNIILIDGGAYDDIKRALRQWIDLYADSLDAELTFELFKNGRAKHVIIADKRLDNERFGYLVNYLHYPEGIEYTIKIEGFITSTDKKLFPEKYLNKKLLLFISDHDTAGDNVYGVTADNEGIKIDFGGKLTSVNVSKQFHEPSVDISGLTVTDVLTVLKKTNKPLLNKEIKADKTGKRFKMGVLIILGLLLLCYIRIQDTQAFLKFTFAVGFGVWFWLFIDYKMLRINRYYLGSLILSILILLYGYLLVRHYSSINDPGIFTSGAVNPIFFLILQRPLRFAFKAIMKREPVVDKPAPSFADFVYMFTLWMASLLVPLFITK